MLQVVEHKAMLKDTHAQGQTMSAENMAFCSMVVKGCLKACAPLSAVDHMRPAIEASARPGLRLTDSSHLRTFIPTVHKLTVGTLKIDQAAAHQEFAVFTDATTCADQEWIAVGVRYTDAALYVQQRAAVMLALNHHCGGHDNVDVIMMAAARLGIGIERLIAIIADRAGGNGVLNRIAASSCTVAGGAGVSNIGCVTHTTNNAGTKFAVPLATKVMDHVRGATANSNVAKRLFADMHPDGDKLPSSAGHRWWNSVVQMMTAFDLGLPGLLEFATKLQSQELCKKSSEKLIRMLNDPTVQAMVLVEMTAVAEAARVMLAFTFTMESNAPVVLVAHEEIRKLLLSCEEDCPMPRLDAACAAAAKLVAGAGAQPGQAEATRGGALAPAVAGPLQADCDAAAKAVTELRARRPAEGPVYVVGQLVDGVQRAHARLRGSITAVTVTDDGRAWVELKYDCTGNTEQAWEHEVLPVGARRVQQGKREADNATREGAQQGRLAELADAEADLASATQALAAAKAEHASRTPSAAAPAAETRHKTAAEYKARGLAAVRPGREYVRERFSTTGDEFKGRGQLAVNAGVKACKAYLSTRCFDPLEWHAFKSPDEVRAVLDGLLEYDFVTASMVAAAKEEVPALYAHVQNAPSALPTVDVADEAIMQSGSTAKKWAARQRIARRRAGVVEPVASSQEPAPPVAHRQGDPELLSATVSASKTVKAVRKESNAVIKKAYAILEWWRLPSSAAPGAKPRHEAFPAWGRLLRLIALVSPSSGAAERMFSLLKLILGDQRHGQLGETVEASLLLRHNDVDV